MSDKKLMSQLHTAGQNALHYVAAEFQLKVQDTDFQAVRQTIAKKRVCDRFATHFADEALEIAGIKSVEIVEAALPINEGPLFHNYVLVNGLISVDGTYQQFSDRTELITPEVLIADSAEKVRTILEMARIPEEQHYIWDPKPETHNRQLITENSWEIYLREQQEAPN